MERNPFLEQKAAKTSNAVSIQVVIMVGIHLQSNYLRIHM